MKTVPVTYTAESSQLPNNSCFCASKGGYFEKFFGYPEIGELANPIAVRLTSLEALAMHNTQLVTPSWMCDALHVTQDEMCLPLEILTDMYWGKSPQPKEHVAHLMFAKDKKAIVRIVRASWRGSTPFLTAHFADEGDIVSRQKFPDAVLFSTNHALIIPTMLG